MRILATILNLIFPTRCLSCGSNESDFCPKCLVKCPAAERESLKWIYPIFDYRHPCIKKAIWLLKYKNNKRLGVIFAEAIYGRILEELSELSVMENFREPILIPVPLSKKRYRERGFNQAKLLCEQLVEIDASKNFKLNTDILIKSKDTKHQAHIENRTQRLKNIVGSFSVKNKELIKNKNIILIDDVTTTGATLSEAKKVLRQEGAKKIIAFTVAH